VIEPQPVVEGAGVHLRRSIGGRDLDYLDPFLLLDHPCDTSGLSVRGFSLPIP
jgi:redox-sensitive bicupin YhaK (pirin superfamily)